MDRTFALMGATLALLAVAGGAFGAHALSARLSPSDLDIFEVAVRYQMYHALALIILAVGIGRYEAPALLFAAGWTMVAGVIIFSGSLYILVLTGIRGFGAVTPVGGVLLLAAWGLVIGHLWRGA
jgi:uncharacterized membrane protein YgdD (TMEM256/DUF423 family)